MKNILNLSDQELVINRINALSENSNRLWGKMTVNEMICHCTDQIKMALGKIEIPFSGKFIHTTLLKRLILFGMPAPRGKVMTYKELDQKIAGTKPTNFETDKATLLNTIKCFEIDYPTIEKFVHPSFGKLRKKQWARLIYIHLDHHLKQFGV